MAEPDAFSVKQALWRTGDYTPPFGQINGLPEKELITGIRAFQNRNGLRADGEMKPGGPTERLLRASIGQSDRDAADAVRRNGLTGSVGAEGRNDPADKKTLKTMLTLTGQFDPDSPPEDEDFYLAAAIRNLQSEYGLPRTSTLTPGDETEKVLRQALDRHADGDPRDPYKTPQQTVQVAQTAPSPNQPPSPRAPKRPAQQPAKINPGGRRPVGAYRKQAVSQDEADRYDQELEAQNLPPARQRAYWEFFVAEGGEASDGKTYAGITQSSINLVVDRTGIQKDTSPDSLTPEQRIKVLDALLGTKKDGHSLAPVGGADALELVGDEEAAAALADTILGPIAGKERIEAIQEAINDVEPGAVKVDGLMGKQTFGAYSRLAVNPDTKPLLLDALADRRAEKVSNDKNHEGLKKRFDHFRFRQ